LEWRLAAGGWSATAPLLHFDEHASGVRRDGDEYVVEFTGRAGLRGDRLLVATGRRARADDLGLETVGVEPTRQGIPVDGRMRVTDGVWAIGDATGVWPLTPVGKYQGRVAADNILGRGRTANYDAVARVVFTDPQAASLGEAEGALTATVRLAEVPRTSTYTRAYAESPGFMTLVSDRGAPHRRIRARTGGGRVASAGDGRDPRACAASRAVRRDPALPELLGGLPVHAERARGPDPEAAAADPVRARPRRHRMSSTDVGGCLSQLVSRPPGQREHSLDFRRRMRAEWVPPQGASSVGDRPRGDQEGASDGG
jgi:Pyridine nucleotide-disulphide oxidoreductase